MSARFVLGLGTNLGSRWALLRAALCRVAAIEGVELVAVGRPRRTEALVPPGEPPGPAFLNGVAELRSALGPEALLDRLHAVEVELGRVRDRKWAARTLDLDLLAWDGHPIETDRLVLPHSGLEQRTFARAGVADLGWGPPVDDPAAPFEPAPRRPGGQIVAADDADALAWALWIGPPSGPFQPLDAASPEAFVSEASRRRAGAAVVFELGRRVRGATAPSPAPAPARRALDHLESGRCRLRIVD
jgi:2-amino-4-hydroxy-6-hydroxymethyldihydropteridine diphosphokinase